MKVKRCLCWCLSRLWTSSAPLLVVVLVEMVRGYMPPAGGCRTADYMREEDSSLERQGLIQVSRCTCTNSIREKRRLPIQWLQT